VIMTDREQDEDLLHALMELNEETRYVAPRILRQRVANGEPLVAPPIPLNQNQEIAIPVAGANFKLHAINVFCTWPQCDADKGEVLARIMAQHDVSWAVVCKEDHHETDGVHLHAIIHHSHKKNWKSTTLLDAFAGKPGHYEAARNLKMSVIYVTKDGDWVANGIDVDKFVEEKKGAKSSIIAEMIKKDTPLPEIMEKESGFWMLHSNQIQNFAAEWSAVKEAKTLTGYKPVNFGVRMTPWEKDIGIWLNTNLNGSVRGLGKPQLFIYGKTQLGKSHLMMQLSKMVKTFFATSCEHFFDGLDGTYDLMVMDEFHGQQTVTFMNQLLDGQCMVLPQKGHQYHKKKNLAIIICSNYAPKDCYRKVYEENRDHFDAFFRRLTVVEINSRLDLWPAPPALPRQNAFLM